MGRNFNGMDKDKVRQALYLLYDIEDELELSEEEEVLYSTAELCVSAIANMIENKSYDPIDNGMENYVPDMIPQPEEIPIQCRGCMQHPANGGSGICHCTLGTTFSL